jgi:outer membrane protein assembly factor BamA
LIQKISHYIYILFFVFFSSDFFAQKLNLKIASTREAENLILNKMEYQKKHTDTVSIGNEIYKISKYLKINGYFTHTVDSVQKTSKEHLVYFSLNDKIDNAVLKTNSDVSFLVATHTIENNLISIPIEKLQPLLLKISKSLDNQGRSFSKVQLKNILIKDKTLFANLEIQSSEKRTINSVLVKGYEAFPTSFLKNYFNIKSNAVFNQKKINEISNTSKGLQFIKEIKPPEILFTKDSTLLYLYFKKHQTNSFDGVVNFASKENGDLLFNGNIDLKLNNVADLGEKFELFWNSIGDERQEFKMVAELPYIFKSPITPEIAFSIYKQDSTFLNTTFNSKIKYSISDKLKVGLTYNSESSNNLQSSNTINSIHTFNSNFIGLHFSYIKPKYDQFFNNKFYLEVTPSFGKRKTTEDSSYQFKIKTITSYIWDINYRNSLFIKNETGFLNSDTYLNNELFRIGGANSIRGFNEQSIFTSSYTFFNIEYRYLTSEKSFIYSITDIGSVKENSEKLLSLGLGYRFINNNSHINIGAVISRNQNKQIQFKNAKIIIDWTIYF